VKSRSKLDAAPVAMRVELLGISPLIWRRIVVSNQSTLASLHKYLQWVFGWQDTHAHEFRVGRRCIGPKWWLAEIKGDQPDISLEDEKRVSVASIVHEVGNRESFEYLYDMGDDWRHRIVLEEVPAAWSKREAPLPICTAGENACPPEDVGGPNGYEHFLECISDAKNTEHEDMLRWIGGVFDPKGFDLNRLNRDWPPSRRSGR
jgi:hypothetical protein